MPLVNIMVNGRAYTIACDDGEEEHLKGLATHVDAKVRELLGQVGNAGEQKLMLMAALLITDEYQDATSELEKLRAKGVSQPSAPSGDARAIGVLDAATKKVADIAAGLAQA